MNSENIQIKKTKAEDFENIMQVEKLAFGYEKEARLVAKLLKDKTGEPLISLLAYYKHEAVGHILFTRAYFADQQEEQPLMHILAPLAVKPDFQRKGIGGMLISTGIELLKQMGSQLIFVLGHKEYYPKYGFIPKAEQLGFPAPYPIPEEYSEYWMVQPLSNKGLDIRKGKIRCCEELDKPQHWRDEETDKI